MARNRRGTHLDRATADSARMGRVPCIRDQRVSVAMVFGQLAAGMSREEILEEYPYLEAEDITAALEYGTARVNESEAPVARTT